MSFLHYNVQSIFSKLDILHTELFDFDILAFTETWLTPAIDTDDVLLRSYNAPERKDRVKDNHGGVMLYVKGLLHCFSTCIEITGNNWYCFILKNVENCKEKFQRVIKL